MKPNRCLVAVALTASLVSLGVFAGEGPATATASKTDTKSGSSNAAPTLEDLLPDVAIARGKGFEIKRSQLDRAVIDAKANATARGQSVITPADLARIQVETLDYLILVKLLNNTATDADKAKGKEDAAKAYESLKKSMMSDEVLMRQLKAVGVTLDEFRSGLEERAIAQAVLHSKVSISDDQIKKFYDENAEQMQQPETIRARHILLLTVDPDTMQPLNDDQIKAKRQKLEDIRKRAVAGEDFAALAKENSQDTGSRDDGGLLKFTRRQTDPAFEAAAFALKTNEVSDIVPTRYGFHIIKLEEKIPPRKAELSEVSTNIKAYLESIEINKSMPDTYAKLKKDGKVEILDEKLKALEDSVPR